jgi:diacylglycerol kinase family enzyme
MLARVGGVLIVNPVASRVDEESTAEVARILGVDEVLRTERRGHATELARAAVGRVGEVFVFSGDGGYNEVVNGLDAATPVGFVPGGGTSVLPRALGLPRDPIAAARQLAARRRRVISLGRANGRRFAFSAGVGLDAEIIRRADALGRGRTGRRASDVRIAVAAARLLWERRARFDPVLELRGHGRAAFALVANGSPYTYLGPLGLKLAPLARFELGLDVIAPRAVRPAMLPRLVLYVLRGRGQERARDIVHAHDLDRLELVCDSPQPLQLDGEDLGDVTEVVFEAERDALTVLV